MILNEPSASVAIDNILCLAVRTDVPDELYAFLSPCVPWLHRARSESLSNEASIALIYSLWDLYSAGRDLANVAEELRAPTRSAETLARRACDLFAEDIRAPLANKIRQLRSFTGQTIKRSSPKDRRHVSPGQDSGQLEADDRARRRAEDMDIIQDSLDKAWRTVSDPSKKGRFEVSQGTVMNWLRSIAENIFIDEVRKQAGRNARSILGLLANYRDDRLKGQAGKASVSWNKIEEAIRPLIVNAVERWSAKRKAPFFEASEVAPMVLTKVQDHIEAHGLVGARGPDFGENETGEWLNSLTKEVLRQLEHDNADVDVIMPKASTTRTHISTDELPDLAFSPSPGSNNWELYSGLILTLEAAQQACLDLINDYEKGQSSEHRWTGNPPRSRIQDPSRKVLSQSSRHGAEGSLPTVHTQDHNGHRTTMQDVIEALQSDLTRSIETGYHPDTAIENWWQALAPRDKNIYVLQPYYEKGEIATILGLSRTAVSNHLTPLIEKQFKFLVEARHLARERGSTSTHLSTQAIQWIYSTILRTAKRCFKQWIKRPGWETKTGGDDMVLQLARGTITEAFKRLYHHPYDAEGFGELLDQIGRAKLIQCSDEGLLPRHDTAGFSIAVELGLLARNRQ